MLVTVVTAVVFSATLKLAESPPPSLVMTGASFVPVIDTVTVAVVPSAELTVKVSLGKVWPAARA